ncbi:MAG: glycosyltransferase family 4 protein [Actinomycetota bacterium]|nr:glycosyltransferase family 4 protein [Actinomycetota bacterium]
MVPGSSRRIVKILFALHQFFPEHFAGVEILTLGLARELKARGHEPYVFAAKRSFPIHDMEPGEIEDYEYDGIPVRQVGRPKEGLGLHYRLNYENETMADRAREYVREIGPDVVHAMNFHGLSASVVPAFKEFGVPLVYTATDFWTICPVVDLRRHDGEMCRGPDLAHCPRCAMSRPPLIRHPDSQRVIKLLDYAPNVAPRVAGKLSGARLSNYSRLLRRAHELKERSEYDGRAMDLADRTIRLRERSEYVRAAAELLDRIVDLKERSEYVGGAMKLVDHIIAPTRLTRDLLASNGVEEEKIEVSHYGIDASDILGAPVHRNLPPPLRVGFIGTLAPHKGCDILMRAFKSLPSELDATLTIYGNLEKFEAFVKKLRELAGEDERITFAGTFPPGRIGPVLTEMDVLVVPSRWYENTPLVVYSAFAAKTPVIATDLGGLSEIVKHEENGLLFELADAEGLARQLRRLGEEPGLLEKLRAGIGPVRTIEENVDELERLYGALVKERTGI